MVVFSSLFEPTETETIDEARTTDDGTQKQRTMTALKGSVLLPTVVA